MNGRQFLQPIYADEMLEPEATESAEKQAWVGAEPDARLAVRRAATIDFPGG
jgi:hypothetical protein